MDLTPASPVLSRADQASATAEPLASSEQTEIVTPTPPAAPAPAYTAAVSVGAVKAAASGPDPLRVTLAAGGLFGLGALLVLGIREHQRVVAREARRDGYAYRLAREELAYKYLRR